MTFNTDQGSYQEFRSILKERTNSVLAWTGAGLSTQADIPLWKHLRRQLEDSLENKINTFEPDDRASELIHLKSIRSEENHWIAFHRLKERLGQTTYTSTLKAALTPSDEIAIPSAYINIWQLGFEGILNLNLDGLATKAYISIKSDRPLEASGFEIKKHPNILKSPKPFIVNLHGNVDNSTSWVLTHAELKSLTNDDAYLQFIRSCLMTRTILFIGLSVDDVAVGSFLSNIANVYDTPTGPHFWLTDRTDKSIDTWAESMGIRIIRYSSDGGDHKAVTEFFDDLIHFVPTDDIPPPAYVSEPLNGTLGLPSPDELVKLDASEIRRHLNTEAQRILSSADPNKYSAYNEFINKYDEAIYRAWYTSVAPSSNSLLSYTLEEEIASGAFGTVYRAKSREDEDVAIKVLRQEVRKQSSMIQGFRRGVRSMQILSHKQLPGMVRYRDASEIPAFVVMDFVPGPTLREVVEYHEFQEWHEKLDLALKLANIIRSAHTLPERVLHRDIRPPNIILKDYWSDKYNYDLTVLDFDLSWHLGALEKSIMHGRSNTGYLAPEQLIDIKNVSTRNALVDSFGFGMTFFYLISGRDPHPNEQSTTEWSNSVLDASFDVEQCSLRSLPARISRLILKATATKQHERWDLTVIRDEIERIRDFLLNLSDVDSSELVAEELAARCRPDQVGRARDILYDWDQDQLSASYQLPSGVEITIQPLESEGRIEVICRWTSKNTSERRAIYKYLKNEHDRIRSAFTGLNWKISSSNFDTNNFHINATIDTTNVVNNLDEHSNLLRSTIDSLSYQ